MPHELRGQSGAGFEFVQGDPFVSRMRLNDVAGAERQPPFQGEQHRAVGAVADRFRRLSRCDGRR